MTTTTAAANVCSYVRCSFISVVSVVKLFWEKYKFTQNLETNKRSVVMTYPAQKMLIFKQNYFLKLFISFKMA